MAKTKQYVFSARTTEDGLKQLNGLKAKLGISWDDLVVDAVCAHYGLDRAAMALPKAEKPARKAEPAGEVAPAATEAAGADVQPSEATSEKTTTKSGKAAKRDNKQKGGKGKHEKRNTAN